MVGQRAVPLVAVLLAVVGAVSAVHPPAGRAEPPPAAATPEAEARATGQRVEVPERTSPTTRVFANPDGSHTLEQHPVPVRGRRDGRWVPIDTTLRFSDAVRPAAGAVDVAFSPGGTGPLVTLVEGDRRVELSWPEPLPRPELAGDLATYRDVLPGVDLRMRALRHGYAKVFVVKDRAAARDPALRSLSFGLKTRGVALKRDGVGAVVAEDPSGADVFHAGTPKMWDGKRVEQAVPVEVGPDRITLTPDQGLLTGADTTYPVEIDPDMGAGRAAWALVYGTPDRYRGQSYWFGDSDRTAKVGYSAWESPVVLARSYFQFDTSSLIGKHVLGAEFNAFETYAPSCEARPVGLHETGAVHAGTTWNTQPWIGQELGRHHVAAGYSSSCPAKWLGFDVTGAVVNAVTTRTPTTTLMLKAVDEGDSKSWKKFNPDNPSIVVRYNSLPNVPGTPTVDGRACAVVPGQPHLSTTGPRLTATGSDPDGGGLKVKFEWYVRNGAKKGEATTLSQSSGTTFGVTLAPGTYAHGDTLAWRAAAYDDVDWGGWSGWCEATIDTTRPDKAPLVSSTDYPENGVGGGVGRTGSFTLSAEGVADVVAFEYDLHDQPKRRVAATDGTATALVTPPNDAWLDLYARSVDRAGNLSDLRRYHFRAGAGTPAVGQWRLDGYWPTFDAPDGSGRGNNGTIVSSVAGARGGAWTAGRQDDALHLDGRGNVATTGPATRTDSTFTVAAWVRTDLVEPGGPWRTAVSQDGTVMSGFFLQLNPDGRWNFMMPAADADTTRLVAASDTPAVVGRWTHLAGVFDRATGTVSLHVDGVRQARTAKQSTPWHAGGAVQIGRALASRAKVDHFRGSIDDVRVYDRLLSDRELHDLAGHPTAEEGFWQLDEKSGATAGDASGNQRVGTLRGGASWSDLSVVGGGSVRLDGVSGQVETGAHAVRTDSSFTVSAHVRLENANGNWQTAVSQDGAKASGFALRYRPDRKVWSFAVSAGDADVPVMLGADSPEAARTGEWTQLTGVYDHADRQVRLYVNSALVAVTPIPPDVTLSDIPGDLVIGRAKLHSRGDRFWGGEVDQVRVHTGVRTEDQVVDDTRDPQPPPPTLKNGQFARWVGHGAAHVTTLGGAPRGYHFEAPLGFPAPRGAAGTRVLHSCLVGEDEFTSVDAACEGERVVGELGTVYATAPADVPTLTLHRCSVTTTGERFVSPHADCEGQRTVSVLGHSLAEAHLTRYRELDASGEHRSGAHQVAATYRAEASLGVIASTAQPGTTGLYVCRRDRDYFLSAQGDCEGGQVVEWTGAVWPAPTATADVPLLRCKANGTNELFETLDPGCEGGTRDRVLGHVKRQV
ncbi:LamG-like jellyroll fold domain-containing protein [Actinosynnema sp. NPDC023587]|uniref:LamG-like jellyroll fold domain-containing protein n=1 Tax=Actinosynnema sp. NPDC023587 TaxID=3154695 RepID=UPI0033EA4C19